MNVSLQRAKRALPLILMLGAAGAFANEPGSDTSPAAAIDSGATANQHPSGAAAVPRSSDSGLTALSPGRITLFEFPNFSGQKVTIDHGMANDLDWANFSNSSHHATSVKVESGTWRVCSQSQFQGDCRVIGPGEYPQLGGPMFTGIASAEQVIRPELGASDAGQPALSGTPGSTLR